MKKLLYLFLLPLFFLAACSSDKPGETEKPREIVLEPSKTEVEVGETVTFTVTSEGTDLTSRAVIYNITANEPVLGNTFSSDKEGVFQFRAEFGEHISKTIDITVKEEGAIPTDPEIVLTATVEEIFADGEDQVVFTVTKDGEDITSQAIITNLTTDQVIADGVFTTETIGTYEFQADYEDLTSNKETVKAISFIPELSSRRTLFMYMAVADGSFPETDFEDKVAIMRDSYQESYEGNLVVYGDNGKSEPKLVHIFRDLKGEMHVETVSTYPLGYGTATPEGLRAVMLEVKEKFPADSYGMVIRSIGDGWLPSEDLMEQPWTAAAPASVIWDGSNQINGWELAEAIPYNLDYLIFDASYMAGIEIAYELKDKVARIVASGIEILDPGFDYAKIVDRLFGNTFSVVEGIPQDYYNDAMEHTSHQTAMISLINTSKLDRLAEMFKDICDYLPKKEYRVTGIDELHPRGYGYYYDMRATARSFVYSLGANEDAFTDKWPDWDGVIEDCTMTFSTTGYYSTLVDRITPLPGKFSGLSMYIPQEEAYHRDLGEAYVNYKWKRDTGMYVPRID